MTGRFTQLGRQLRKLRHLAGATPAESAVTTVRRATQLACDLAREEAAIEEAPAAFRALAERALLDDALAERLAGYAADVAATSESPRPLAIGGDLDLFLRSLEHGAPAPELPFEALVAGERSRPDSTAAVVISGRVLELEVRGGAATIAIDERAVESAPFRIAQAPLSKPEVHYEPTGVTRVVWSHENVIIEVAANFAQVRVEQA